jgi:hypothetical protein
VRCYRHGRIREKLLNDVGCDLDGGLVFESHFEIVASTEAMLEVLRRAETFELAVDHDGQTRAENIAFGHGMGRQ